MDRLYPVMLRLTGKICVIVGGGTVGARKAAGLLDTGARITIISPTLHPALGKLAEDGLVNIQRLTYTSGMLRNLSPFLVFAATNDTGINQLVDDEARSLGVLVDRVDSGVQTDFMGMSVVRRGAITIALSTGGTSPTLAAHLRERVEAAVGGEYLTLATWMANARPKVKGVVANQRQRAALWSHILGSPILDNLRQGDEENAQLLFDQFLSEYMGDQS